MTNPTTTIEETGAAQPLALSVVHSSERRLTVAEVVARTRLVQEVMRAVMQEGTHYGQIPGTPKPSLWQPGAEQLMVTFQLAPDITVEDLSTAAVVRYRVQIRARAIASGAIVGAGLGECSSDEEKYRWQRAVCREEWNEAPADKRRRKWFRGKDGKPPYQVDQIRTEPADIANTVLKMAKKRALVDCAKSTVAASDIFDQDIEDLPEGVEGSETPARKVGTPTASNGKASAPAANAAPAGPAKANGAPSAPPAREPGSDDEQPPAARLISADKWEPARARWHSSGVISLPQIKRLLAIGMQSGYSAAEIRAEVQAGAGVTLEEICSGPPYDLIVGLFATARPSA